MVNTKILADYIAFAGKYGFRLKKGVSFLTKDIFIDETEYGTNIVIFRTEKNLYETITGEKFINAIAKGIRDKYLDGGDLEIGKNYKIGRFDILNVNTELEKRRYSSLHMIEKYITEHQAQFIANGNFEGYIISLLRLSAKKTKNV